ncbi:unnamed protein product [Heterobilharzia americana]|nr:unnamed protein product [Heterobilharzia americana]
MNNNSNNETRDISLGTSHVNNQNTIHKDDSNKCYASLETDIAVIMKRRAELGYGLDIEGATYVDIVKDDVQLRSMWTWIKCNVIFVCV